MVGLSNEGDLDLLPIGESATGVGVLCGGCCTDCVDSGVALLCFANSSLVGFRAQIRRLKQGQSGRFSNAVFELTRECKCDEPGFSLQLEPSQQEPELPVLTTAWECRIV